MMIGFSKILDSMMTKVITRFHFRESAHLAPKPTGKGLMGNYQQSIEDNLNFPGQMYDLYGPIVRLRYFNKTAHLVFSPNGVEHVLLKNYKNYQKNDPLYKRIRRTFGEGLLTSFGDTWKKSRPLLQPLFTAEVVASHKPIIEECIKDFIQRLEQSSHDQTPLDIGKAISELTLEIACRTLFSEKSHQSFKGIKEAFQAISEELLIQVDSPLAIILPYWVPLPSNLRIRRSKNELRRLAKSILKEKTNLNGKDLLSRMLSSQKSNQQIHFSEDQIIDQILTFMFAGQDTVSQLLTWTFYLLASHPDKQTQLISEIRASSLQENPHHYEVPYLSQTVKETLRLYPPVWILPRKSVERDQIEGYEIPPGSFVFVFPYTNHRDPKYWTNPEQFSPERFADEGIHELPAGCYFPFGIGPRHCIGRNMAPVEVAMILYQSFKRFEISLVEDKHPRCVASLTLSPKEPVFIHIKQIKAK